MKTKLIITIGISTGILIAGCDDASQKRLIQKAAVKVVEQTQPIPIPVEAEQTGPETISITIRNKGIAGRIVVSVTQEDKVWKKNVYFDPNEDRKIKVECEGIKVGPYSYRAVPEELDEK